MEGKVGWEEKTRQEGGTPRDGEGEGGKAVTGGGRVRHQGVPECEPARYNEVGRVGLGVRSFKH